MPPLRLAILEDIAVHPAPASLTSGVGCSARELRLIARSRPCMLGLLTCREEEELREDGPRYIRHYSLAQPISLNVLSVPEMSVDNDF
jgi:hypothetical protein